MKPYHDEYKVMGMSAYGKKYIKDLDKVIAFDDKSLFKLNLKFFSHHVNNLEQININSQINYTDLYSKYFVRVSIFLVKYNKLITILTLLIGIIYLYKVKRMDTLLIHTIMKKSLQY